MFPSHPEQPASWDKSHGPGKKGPLAAARKGDVCKITLKIAVQRENPPKKEEGNGGLKSGNASMISGMVRAGLKPAHTV